jgi:anaerobic selenocysteine-containing dehydrogenase
VPFYDGIQHLAVAGDQVQWGGERLCEELDSNGNSVTCFPTAERRAKFSLISVEDRPGNGKLRLSTRRGKQFNSIVHQSRDPLTGAYRDDVLMSEEDARRLGIVDGAGIIVRSNVGEMRGRCRLSPITPGNVQVHWPEGNVLIRRGVLDSECGIPDYNAEVDIERGEGDQ